VGIEETIMKATKRVLIRVTMNHILRGEKYNNSSCPIALAANEALSTGKLIQPNHVRIFSDTYRLRDDASYSRRRLSAKAERFIARFDFGLAVDPMNFYLRVPA